jgi:hypothetical protein
MSVLALWSPVDLFLGVVGPLGAAAGGGTALLVDLDPNGPRYGALTPLPISLRGDPPVVSSSQPDRDPPCSETEVSLPRTQRRW